MISPQNEAIRPFITGYEEPSQRLRARCMETASNDRSDLEMDAFLPREGSGCAKETKETKEKDDGSRGLLMPRSSSSHSSLLVGSVAQEHGEDRDTLGRGKMIV